MAVELATAYISLVPTTVNLKPAMEKQFAPAQAVAASSGKEAGGRFADGFSSSTSRVGSALGTALKGGIAIATAAAGAAGAVGIKTAAAMEQSEISFTTMLGSAQKAKAFLGDLSKFAAKTPFDMPGLQTAASSLVSAGIDANKVIPIMTSLGNATSGMGTGSEGIKRATVALQQMNAAGKISGEDLNQLRDAGIPVFDLLTAATGKTTAEIAEMANKGKLGREELEQLMTALETGKGLERFNGLMEKQSASLTGLWSSFQDTFAMGMADVVKPLIPLLKQGLGGATAFLTDVAFPKAKAALSGFVTGLAGFIKRIVAFKTGLDSGAFTPDLVRALGLDPTQGFGLAMNEAIGGIRAFGAAWQYNDGEVTSSGFPGFMERLAFIVHQAWDEMRGGVLAFNAAWHYNDGDITSSGFPGFMEGLAYNIHQGWDKAAGSISAFTAAWNANDGDVTSSGFNGFMERSAFFLRQVQAGLGRLDFSGFDAFFASLGNMGGTVGPALGSIGDSFKTLWPAVKEFGEQTPDLFSSGITIVAQAMAFLADHVDDIIRWMPLIVAGFVAWKAAQVAISAAQKAAVPVQLILNVTRIAAARAERANAVALRQSTVATVQSTAAASANNGAQRVGLITRLRSTAALIGQKVATLAAAAATRAAAAGQWLMNAAMSANPIGIVVLAIAALVAGLVWFFTQTELGQQIIQNVWGAIQGFIGGFIGWFQGTVVPGFQAAMAQVGGFFTWLWVNAVQPAIGFISSVIAGLVTWFQTVLVPGVQTTLAAVGAVFTWLWVNIIQPAFSSISTIVGGFYLFFRFIFQAIVAVITQIVVPALMWFWQSVIVPVFKAIGDVVAFWWNGIVMPVFNAVIGFFTKTIPAAARWLYENAIKPVFDAIGRVVSVWWNGLVMPVLRAVIGFFRDTVPAAATWLWQYGIKPVFDAIGKLVSDWWNLVVMPVLNTVVGFFRDTLPAAANWLYTNGIKPVFDKIGAAIKFVWETVIKPVFDKLSNTIQKDIPKAFEEGKKFVKKIWEGLQEVVKAPIRFVVQKVLNEGLIAGMNGIATILHIDTLPPVALPPGFAAGGWTGPGSKNQPAGIVHADEFVLRKEARRRMESSAPGLLDHMNRYGTWIGYAGGGRVRPLKDLILTQGYNRVHKGVDFAAGEGTPVFATQDGVVDWAGPGATAPGVWGGNEVHILGSGIETWFAHLSRIMVSLGQNVRAGQQIALSGNTGITSGPHLHFGVFSGGWPNDVDPLGYLGGANVPTGGGGGGFNPIAAIIDGLIDKFKEAFPGGGFVIDMIAGLGKTLLQEVSDFVTGIFNGSTDKKGNAVGATLFDGGGWLENTGGLQLVAHNQRRPDAVLSNTQWDAMFRIAEHASAGATEINFNGPVYGDPQHIVDELEARKRRAATRNNLRAITVGG